MRGQRQAWALGVGGRHSPAETAAETVAFSAPVGSWAVESSAITARRRRRDWRQWACGRWGWPRGGWRLGGGGQSGCYAAAVREEAGVYALTAPATLPPFGLPFLLRSGRAPSAPPPRPQPPSSLHLRCRCRCRWLCTFHVAATSPRCCRRRLRPLSTSQALPPPHPSL